MPKYRIRAVVFREGEHWVAQCLEYSYAIQARELRDLPRELGECLAAQILVSRQMGLEPFEGFEPAPRRFWELYERANPLSEPVEATASGAQVQMRLAA
jgi:hypothetical protein